MNDFMASPLYLTVLAILCLALIANFGACVTLIINQIRLQRQLKRLNDFNQKREKIRRQD